MAVDPAATGDPASDPGRGLVEPPPYGIIARGIVRGRVTPLLGAGVNVYGRAAGDWRARRGFLPDGNELADHLADTFDFMEEARDLVRVSQFVALEAGEADLYDELHGIFDSEYAPNELHTFFATWSKALHQQARPSAHLLFVTTNYDDALEVAFDRARQEYDLFSYVPEKQRQGAFVHRLPDGSERRVENANQYAPDLLEERPAILKIHGAVRRGDPSGDSYVITEDDYIDYLSHSDISALVPAALKARMKGHFLFLGYSLRDWNLRAFLHRVWAERQRESRSWAIQLHPDRLEKKRWAQRHVDIYDMRLEDFIRELGAALREQMDGGPAP